MQTGIYVWFGYTIPIKERLKLIASTGFNNISFWWGDQYINIDGPKEILPEMARQAGLYIENIHTDYERTNLLWIDKIDWENIFNRYMESIEACFCHQIPTMVLHLTNGDNPPAPNELGISRLMRLVEHAEKRNIFMNAVL